MFASETALQKPPPLSDRMGTAAIEAVIGRLRDHGCAADVDAERVTQIRLLETLKSVASAVKAELTADFARSGRSSSPGSPPNQCGTKPAATSAPRSG